MTHLMELLKAHESRDAEASRLQQALQCQEEADAAKLVELMRRQEAASAAAVEEAKAAIEAQLVERFREEQAAAAEAHSAHGGGRHPGATRSIVGSVMGIQDIVHMVGLYSTLAEHD